MGDAFRADKFVEALAIADRHESFDDWPWPALYREMDDRYPDALFVLTVRRVALTCAAFSRARPTGAEFSRQLRPQLAGGVAWPS